MSGQATGWVLRHGPCTTWAAARGVKKDRAAQAVLTAIADAANRDGENAHPGMAAMIDASGYGRSTVFDALRRLTEGGWIEVTEEGGGRGNATVYRVPGVADTEWLPAAETVQSSDGPTDGNGPDDGAKGSNPAGETVQMSPAAPITQRTTNGSNNASDDDAAFEEFYAAYPRKVGKGDARKAWGTAAKAAPAETIIEGARRYATEVRGKDPQYVKHPGPWLRAERWADEPGANAVRGSGVRRTIDSDRSAGSGAVAL